MAATAKKKPEEESSGSGSGSDFESKHPRARSAPTGGQFIKTGSSGSRVERVQKAVGAKVDGEYGEQTARKVRRFQRKHGLQVDGIVGRQTMAAVRGNYAKARKTEPGVLKRP